MFQTNWCIYQLFDYLAHTKNKWFANTTLYNGEN